MMMPTMYLNILIQTFWANAVCWERDTILTVSVDKSARLWDRKNVAPPEPPTDMLMAIRFVDHGKRLHTLSKSQELIVLDTSTVDLSPLPVVERREPPEGAGLQDYAFISPNGNDWAYGSYDSNYHVYHSGTLRTRSTGVDVCSKLAVWDPTGTIHSISSTHI
jgi:WD40 repeat protein